MSVKTVKFSIEKRQRRQKKEKLTVVRVTVALAWPGLILVSNTPYCISGKLDKSIQSNSGDSTKQSVKVYYRQALGMIRISNHRPDLGPIHPHLTYSIKRLVVVVGGGGK